MTTAVPPNQHSEQKTAFQALTNDLKNRNITMQVEFSEQLHDRQVMCVFIFIQIYMPIKANIQYQLICVLFFDPIRLSNGYIIKIGRGLHYFLPAEKFCLGTSNYDFRKCKETNIDIFYCPENKTS